MYYAKTIPPTYTGQVGYISLYTTYNSYPLIFYNQYYSSIVSSAVKNTILLKRTLITTVYLPLF